jgi:hypothetical protein
MAPANTGNDSSNKNEVTSNAHINSGILKKLNDFVRILKIVTIKFIDPINEEAPARCKLNITKSTGGPG